MLRFAALRRLRSCASLRSAILRLPDRQPRKISDKKKGPNFSEPLFLIRANCWPRDIYPRSPICDQRDLFRDRSNFSIQAEIREFAARLSAWRRSNSCEIPARISVRLCSARRSTNSRSICISQIPFSDCEINCADQRGDCRIIAEPLRPADNVKAETGLPDIETAIRGNRDFHFPNSFFLISNDRTIYGKS